MIISMREKLISYIKVIFWSFIFALSCNLFIVPFGLYNGGIVGTSQVLRTIITRYLGISINFDLAGLINLTINIPLLIIAHKKFNKSFVGKTAASLITQSIAFSIVFEKSLINDCLASIVVGGAISGFAVGRILSEKSSGGGNDIIGMFLAHDFKKISVGQYSLYYNVVLYIACALLFNPEVAIYSIIQSFIYSYVIDKEHLENRDVTLMIFTKNIDVKWMIMSKHVRGVTTWSGKGAYTDKDTEVLVTVVSRYEVENIKEDIRKLDANAFVIMSDVSSVEGGYEKRLI